jgi:hypothetical protein
MYLDERMPTRSLIGNLFLHRIKSRTGILILAADNLRKPTKRTACLSDWLRCSMPKSIAPAPDLRTRLTLS